jgi:hypothetical protein
VRDWEKFVRERLDLGSLDRTQRDEIAVEIAGHLEDLCEDSRTHGLCDPETLRSTRDQVPDWNRLSRRIQRARRKEGGMNDRTRQIWLPGLASLMAANLLLLALTRISLEPHVILSRSTCVFPGLELTLAYVPWLVAQPLVGAFGACLSHRAGGGRLARLAAGLFPSIVMLALWLVVIPASVFIERNTVALRHPLYVVMGGLVWVAPAAMGLLFGCFPFIAEPPRYLGQED